MSSLDNRILYKNASEACSIDGSEDRQIVLLAADTPLLAEAFDVLYSHKLAVCHCLYQLGV